jgi:hypothetical protein
MRNQDRTLAELVEAFSLDQSLIVEINASSIMGALRALGQSWLRQNCARR